MAKQHDTYEMLDTSPDKPSHGVLIGLVVLAIVFAGALAAYFMIDRDPAKSLADAKQSLVKTEPSAASPPVNVASSVAPTVVDQSLPANEVPKSSDEMKTDVSATAATEPAKEISRPIEEKPIQTQVQQSAATVDNKPITPLSAEQVTEAVHFPFNKDDPFPSEVDKLHAFCIGIRNKSGIITVEGYSDGIGYDSYNQELSDRRAKNVAAMIQKIDTIDQCKFTVRGMGKTNPIGSNSTKEGRASNRRAVISFVAER
jgi:outer membrane protein OmpA-like peptidoglycan-associated protein